MYIHDCEPLKTTFTFVEVVHRQQGRPRGWEVYGPSSLYFDSEQLCLSVEYYLVVVGNEPVKIPETE